jgi:hypothetical protein
MQNPYETLAARAARLRAETEADLREQLDALSASAARKLRGSEPIRVSVRDVNLELAGVTWASWFLD